MIALMQGSFTPPDEVILREAGFSNISLFYVGFTFRGWVACA